MQTQQIASSQLRAVESGRWLVQVSPTGFSAFVDPDGTVSQRTGVSEQKVITGTVEMLDSTTPAQALGALPALLLAAAAIAVAQWRLRPARGRDGGDGGGSSDGEPSETLTPPASA